MDFDNRCHRDVIVQRLAHRSHGGGGNLHDRKVDVRGSSRYGRSSIDDTKAVLVVVAMPSSIGTPIGIGRIGNAGSVDEDLLDIPPSEVGVGLEDEGNHSCDQGCRSGGSAE